MEQILTWLPLLNYGFHISTIYISVSDSSQQLKSRASGKVAGVTELEEMKRDEDPSFLELSLRYIPHN